MLSYRFPKMLVAQQPRVVRVGQKADLDQHGRHVAVRIAQDLQARVLTLGIPLRSPVPQTVRRYGRSEPLSECTAASVPFGCERLDAGCLSRTCVGMDREKQVAPGRHGLRPAPAQSRKLLARPGEHGLVARGPQVMANPGDHVQREIVLDEAVCVGAGKGVATACAVACVERDPHCRAFFHCW
jgi:hypothetical protein